MKISRPSENLPKRLVQTETDIAIAYSIHGTHREGMAALADQGARLYMPFYLARLAELEADMGESD